MPGALRQSEGPPQLPLSGPFSSLPLLRGYYSARRQLSAGASRAPQLRQEVPAHQQRAEREDDVAGQAHPLPETGLVVEGLAARPGQAMLVDGVELRPADREEVEEDPHRQARIVAPEGDAPEPLVEDRVRARSIAQAEVDETKREQPERSEQRGMRMIERQEGAVLVIIDERGVDRPAAKDSGADEIPEGGAEDVEVGEAVIERCRALDRAVLRDRFQDQEDQRQHLDEGEHRAERHPHAWAARPIEVMAGTEHAAHEDEDQLEVDRAFGEFPGDEAERHQQVRAHRHGEELERLLDPEVDDPPAPEVGQGKALLDPRERDHAEDVQHRDVDRRGPDQMLEPDLASPELLRGLDQRVAARPARGT